MELPLVKGFFGSPQTPQSTTQGRRNTVPQHDGVRSPPAVDCHLGDSRMKRFPARHIADSRRNKGMTIRGYASHVFSSALNIKTFAGTIASSRFCGLLIITISGRRPPPTSRHLRQRCSEDVNRLSLDITPLIVLHYCNN